MSCSMCALERDENPGADQGNFDIAQGSYQVGLESLESLDACWVDSSNHLNWNCLFVLPPWLSAWWSALGKSHTARIYSVRRGDEILGVAPLVVEGRTARFMGSSDVSDYLDFIVAPGREASFLEVLLKHLHREGIRDLKLEPVRSDSVVMTHLSKTAGDLHLPFSCRHDDVTMEMELPDSWEQFLDALTGKERHEIRRKLRRIHKAARVEHQIVDDLHELAGRLESFLHLFTSSREDKDAFMTVERISFFRSLATNMSAKKMMQLLFLCLDGKDVAGVMCFDHHSTRYLYNNGYDPHFQSLSVGLLSKVFSIKFAIEDGRRHYDFLKGREVYKHRLGGRPIQLYTCHCALG